MPQRISEMNACKREGCPGQPMKAPLAAEELLPYCSRLCAEVDRSIHKVKRKIETAKTDSGRMLGEVALTELLVVAQAVSNWRECTDEVAAEVSAENAARRQELAAQQRQAEAH